LKVVLSGVAAAALALAPSLAQACPSCAGRNDGNITPYAVGSMILLPFLVAGVTYKVIRRNEDQGTSKSE
jgi:hypothetical protein